MNLFVPIRGAGGSNGSRPVTRPLATDLSAARTTLVQALQQVFAREATTTAAQPLAITDQIDFLRALRRHRLATVLAPHAEELGLPPETAGLLREEARRQQMVALPLVALAQEVVPALQDAGLRALVLKGPALAIQTTGQPLGRGGGDLDLLVAPEDLPAAVAVLEGLGFHSPAGLFPRNLHSFWGRYARWASHELSLQRPGSPWLDVHWALGNVRAPLPDFADLWQERELVSLNGRSMPTLSRRHAFLHGCFHAAADQWMNLHHLLDLARLAERMPPSEVLRLRQVGPVQLSCAAAHAATGSPGLLPYTNLRRADCRRAIARARWTQAQPPRASAEGAWHPCHWLGIVSHLASLSPSPIDWLRVVVRFSLLPAAFSDPLTGQDRGLFAMLEARWQRLLERLREHR